MKKIIYFSGLLLMACILASCGATKASIANNVKQSFQSKMDTDATYSQFGVKVESVNLIETGTGAYNGIVTIKLGDKTTTHDISITVTTDGSSYQWQMPGNAFDFLATDLWNQTVDIGTQAAQIMKDNGMEPAKYMFSFFALPSMTQEVKDKLLPLAQEMKKIDSMVSALSLRGQQAYEEESTNYTTNSMLGGLFGAQTGQGQQNPENLIMDIASIAGGIVVLSVMATTL